MAEMRYPEQFPRALMSLIAIQTTFYLVVTFTVLHFLGEVSRRDSLPFVALSQLVRCVPPQYATSPVIASLSPSMERVCYIIALPAILIPGCSSGQVSAKQLYVYVLRRIPSIKMKATSTWLAWILINISTWTSAWILAE